MHFQHSGWILRRRHRWSNQLQAPLTCCRNTPCGFYYRCGQRPRRSWRHRCRLTTMTNDMIPRDVVDVGAEDAFRWCQRGSLEGGPWPPLQTVLAKGGQGQSIRIRKNRKKGEGAKATKRDPLWPPPWPPPFSSATSIYLCQLLSCTPPLMQRKRAFL